MSKLKKHAVEALEPNSRAYFRILIDNTLCALNGHNLSTAWKFINRAGQLNQKSAEVYLLKGAIIEAMGHLYDALLYYDQSLKMQPDYTRALFAYLKLANQLSLSHSHILKYRAEELLVQSQFRDALGFQLASKYLLKLKGQPFLGAVWIHKQKLMGWAVNLNQPKKSIKINYEDRGTPQFISVDQPSDFLLQAGIGNGFNQFSITINQISSNSIFYFPDGSNIPGAPIYLPSEQINTQRYQKFEEVKSSIKSSKKTPILHIIIPVYKDLTSLKRCMDSLFNSKNRLKFNIILINDASPEADISSYLEALSQIENIILLKNQFNLGFVKSVNRGLFYKQGGDCLLLNSDTIVYSNWLDRLYKAAYSSDNVGTVTPLSNNSELTSYPIIHYNNSLDSFSSLQEIDTIASTKNKKQYIDIPSGVGFCFYIKRQCLNECGGLNEKDILRGYGDEAEFCQRIAEQGWRNICATDVFVAHEGGKSFSHEKRKLALKNMEYLEKIYPDYKQSYWSFIQRDPLHYYRYRIEQQQLLSFPRCKKLILLDAEQRIPEHEILEAIKDNCSIYWLKPEQRQNGKFFRLGRDREKTPANFRYRLPSEKKRLINDLKILNVPHIEYRDVVHYLQFMTDLPRILKCSYSLTPNNYALVCPRIYLIREDDTYCEGPEVNKCALCLKKSGALFEYELYREQDISSFNEQGEALLKNSLTQNQIEKRIKKFVYYANTFKVDSIDSSKKFLQVFPELNISLNGENIALLQKNFKQGLTPHSFSEKTQGSLKIAIPHNVNRYSGYNLLLQLASYVQNHDLAIEFLVFGSTINDSALQATGKVFVSDAVKNSEYDLLKKRYACNTVLFLYQWPISITSELLLCHENKLKIAAFNLGCFKEHLKNNSRFLLFPLDANIERICTRLINWSFNES